MTATAAATADAATEEALNGPVPVVQRLHHLLLHRRARAAVNIFEVQQRFLQSQLLCTHL